MNARYQSYLNSPEWKTLRSLARDRAGNKCEMCEGPPDHVHHVKYPKVFKDDHLDNLVVVCERCHNKLHGIRKELHYGEYVGETVGVRLDERLNIMLSVEFKPISLRSCDPKPLHELKKIRPEYAEELTKLFDGICLNIDEINVIELPIDHAVFNSLEEKSFKDYLFSLLEYQNSSEVGLLDAEDLLEKTILYLSPGPTTCPCKIRLNK